LRMLACVACIFLIFSASALAQEPNSSRGQDLSRASAKPRLTLSTLHLS
jgi:hypothetical protein